MPNNPSLTSLWLVGVSAGLLMSACSPPDRAAVQRQLETHRNAFESIAEEWARTPVGAEYCYFPKAWYVVRGGDDYRWGQRFLKGVAGGRYEIIGGPSQSPNQTVSLNEAAVAIGTTQDELAKWRRLIEHLPIACISHASGYVEVMFTGSRHARYGARYTPNDERNAFERMSQRSGTQLEIGDSEFVHLFGRWFYYVSN